jgi:hypothetical protein
MGAKIMKGLEDKEYCIMNLDQFTQKVALITRLINPGLTPRVWYPETISGHPVAQRLSGDPDAMTFEKLLGG